MVPVTPHPLLDPILLEARWPLSLGALPAAPWMRELVPEPGAPLPPEVPFRDEAAVLAGPHKKAVRDLLRVGGFKPSGRDKPCWEYLVGVAGKGRFPWINPAVDATNLAALYGALPVSTIDADKLVGALRIGVGEPGASVVFNASGQELGVGGLLCLFDGEGPVANAVKDSQRTKTGDGTTRTLTIVWGTSELAGRSRQVADWQRALFQRCGASVDELVTES